MAVTILGIDSTGDELAVGLLINGHMSTVKASGRPHSHVLLPLIAKLLGRKKPTALAVSIGPGSYTGTRVGVTVANTLSWSWGAPIYGVSKGDADTMEKLLEAARSRYKKGDRPTRALPRYGHH